MAAAALAWAAASAQAVPTYSACIEPEPPPWAFWVRDTHGQATTELTGVSVDLLRAAFDRLGVKLLIHGEYPWARCMQMVATGQIDFALDGYRDAHRARTYSFSRPYRTLTPQVFYLQSAGFAVATLSDLKRLKGCGQHGWSYAHYGLSGTDLDLGIGLVGMIKKLKAGRCDYFVEELETVYSARFNGTDLLADPAIGHGPASWASAPQAHLMARLGSTASSLMPQVNRALTELIESGRAAAIWARHAPGLPFKP